MNTFIQKVQHHAAFVFLVFTLLAQSLVFVASKAVSINSYPLQAEWSSPKNGQTFVIGQVIDFRAKIEAKDQKIGSVYFVLSDEYTNFIFHFQTAKDESGFYHNVASGSTTDWPSGIYRVVAHATVLNAEGKVEGKGIEARPIYIRLISNEQLKQQGSDQVQDSAVSALPSGLAQVDSDQALSIDGNEDNINSTSTDNTATSTVSQSDENSTSTPSNLPPSLEMLVPENNATITERQFLVRFLTNFVADTVNVEFINTENAAISTRPIVIEKSDGYNWVKTIELDDTFVNGSYKLLITAVVPGTANLVAKSFDYDLDVPVDIRPEDLFMNLMNVPSNVQGEIALRADANLPINNLDFVIEDSINHQEALRIKGINISTNNSATPTFLANWDTAVLANGNYLIFVESRIDQQKVGSTKQLVTVYNANNDQQATSTPPELEEQEPVIASSTQPLSTSTQAKINTVAPNLVSGIDCERSGISDQGLCRKYQAELNDTLPMLCVEEGIFDGTECEKYILANNDICTKNNIIDSAQCQAYLLKTYGSTLRCGLSATSTCQAEVIEKYISRLAYATEQRNRLALTLEKISKDTMTLNNLSAKLAENNLASSTLSLALSEKNIDIYKIKNNNLVDPADNLLLASPALLIGDRDGDKLPDDLEAYYNTDASQVDSDGDGFTDGEEVANNYNPLGAGPLDKERTTLDLALFAKVVLEEPKTSQLLASENWQVMNASSEPDGLKLSGKALANSWVNIFIYSDIPYLATTKTDLNGNWSYALSDPLSEGVHQVYVASNDKGGRLLAKSLPLTFLVANVKNDQVVADLNQRIEVINDTAPVATNWTVYYIIGGALLLLVLLGVVLLLIKRHKNKPDALVKEAMEESKQVVPSPGINAATTSATVPVSNNEIHLPDTEVISPPPAQENKDLKTP